MDLQTDKKKPIIETAAVYKYDLTEYTVCQRSLVHRYILSC